METLCDYAVGEGHAWMQIDAHVASNEDLLKYYSSRNSSEWFSYCLQKISPCCLQINLLYFSPVSGTAVSVVTVVSLVTWRLCQDPAQCVVSGVSHADPC